MIKGLLIKDLLLLKKNLVMALGLTILYSVMGYLGDNTEFFSGIILIFFSILCISTFAFDEQAKWASYALSTPITRKILVSSKYVCTFVMFFLGLIFSLVPQLTQFIFHSKTDAWSLSPIFGAFIWATLVLNFIMLPLLFKFGSEKSRLFLFVLCGLPTIILLLIVKNPITLSISKDTLNTILNILPYAGVISCICFGIISYMVSVRIMKNKEF